MHEDAVVPRSRRLLALNEITFSVISFTFGAAGE